MRTIRLLTCFFSLALLLVACSDCEGLTGGDSTSQGDDPQPGEDDPQTDEGPDDSLLPPDLRPAQRLSDLLRDMERPLENGILVITKADDVRPRAVTARCSDETAGAYLDIWSQYAFVDVECADDMSQCRLEPPATTARYLPHSTVFYESPNKIGAVVEHGPNDRVTQTFEELVAIRTEVCDFQAALAEPDSLTIDRFGVYDHRSIGEDVWLANDFERHLCGDDAVSFARALLPTITTRSIGYCEHEPLSCTVLDEESRRELTIFGRALDGGGGYAIAGVAHLGVPDGSNAEARGRRLADLNGFLERISGEAVPELPEGSEVSWPSFVPRELQQGQVCP